MVAIASERSGAPIWLLVVAGLGTAWNVFGNVQLGALIGQTHESLMMKGMSPAAARLYYASLDEAGICGG